MKSKIKRVQSVRLLNSEYSIFVSQLVAIFQQYDLDLLHLKKAFEALSLKLFFDYLRTVNQQFADMYLQRIDEVTEVEIVDARAIRIETDKVLKDLLDAFEFCSGEYEELDYETPAKKLNELTTSYILELKARATRSKEDKNVSKEPIAGAAI